jgi:hypothetical protein
LLLVAIKYCGLIIVLHHDSSFAGLSRVRSFPRNRMFRVNPRICLSYIVLVQYITSHIRVLVRSSLPVALVRPSYRKTRMKFISYRHVPYHYLYRRALLLPGMYSATSPETLHYISASTLCSRRINLPRTELTTFPPDRFSADLNFRRLSLSRTDLPLDEPSIILVSAHPQLYFRLLCPYFC